MGAGWIVLIVLGSLALLILLLLLSHVRLRLFYNENGSGLRISWFVIRKKMDVDDAAGLLEGHKKEKPGKETEEKTEEPEPEPEKKKAPISWQLERITRLLGRIIDRLPGTLTLRTRRIVVTVSTDDAAKTALLYGAVSATLAGLIEFLDRSVARIKTKGRDLIDVRADFVSGKTRADIDLVLSAKVAGALRILFLFLTSDAKPKKHKKSAKPEQKSDPAPAAIAPKNV